MDMENQKKERRVCTSTMKFIGIAAVIGLFILTFSFSFAWGKYEDQIEEKSNTDVFATIDLEDFDGQPFTKDDLSGAGLIAFNVWETTCPACLREMGDLEKLSNEYDPSEFRLVGMCADLYDANGKLKPKQVEKAKELMSAAGVTFTNLIPDQGFQNFFRATIAGFPTTYFVDSEGKVIDVTSGAKDFDKWKEYVEAELEKVK